MTTHRKTIKRYGAGKNENPYRGMYYPCLDGRVYPLTAFKMIIGTMALLQDITRNRGHRASGSYMKQNMINGGYSPDQYNRVPIWAEKQGYITAEKCLKGGGKIYRATAKGRALHNSYVIELDANHTMYAHKWRIIANLTTHYFKKPPSKRQLSSLLGWSRNSFDYSPDLFTGETLNLYSADNSES